MICIICKSSFLSNEIKKICADHSNEKIEIIDCKNNECHLSSITGKLFTLISSMEVSTVFFETDIFMDTALFRKKSPNTKFIAIVSYWNQLQAEEAIINGASNFLIKPFSTNGVINCL